MTTITSETELRDWATSGSAGVVTLANDITITNISTITIDKNFLFEGEGTP